MPAYTRQTNRFLEWVIKHEKSSLKCRWLALDPETRTCKDFKAYEIWEVAHTLAGCGIRAPWYILRGCKYAIIKRRARTSRKSAEECQENGPNGLSEKTGRHQHFNEKLYSAYKSLGGHEIGTADDNK